MEFIKILFCVFSLLLLFDFASVDCYQNAIVHCCYLSKFQALKALALLRLGRSDESKALLEDVHSQHPTDDSTLQAMAISYKETHRCK